MWPFGRPKKHTTYFELLGALDQAECPICSLGLRGVARYLDLLSYENVNDVLSRERLRAARGFCNAHAWHVFDNGHDGLGIAIIYRDIINNLLRTLAPAEAGSAWDRARPPAGTLATQLEAKASCPACDHATDTSARYLSALLAHFPEPELRDKYQGSPGLCLPHLRQALASVRAAEDASLLVAVWRQRVESLRGQLMAAREGEDAPVIRALVGAPALNEGGSEYRPGRAIVAASPGAVEALAGACAEDGCPLCRCVTRGVEGYLLILPKELHRRRPRAQEVYEAHGLCNRHAWQVAAQGPERRDPRLWQLALAGAAEALDDLPRIEDAPWRPGLVARLRGARPEGAGEPLAEALRPQALCPVCRAQAEIERQWAEAMLVGLRKEAFASTFAHSHGLCLPHFLTVLRLTVGDPARDPLERAQVAAWQALRGELDEFIRKHDYRFAAEPMGSERDSPWRAIAQVAGARWLRDASAPDPRR